MSFASFECQKCGHKFQNFPGPQQCNKCGHKYLKWVNYERDFAVYEDYLKLLYTYSSKGFGGEQK